jgi:hypothetical protein
VHCGHLPGDYLRQRCSDRLLTASWQLMPQLIQFQGRWR